MKSLRVGISPDFYVDLKDKFELILEEKFRDLDYGPANNWYDLDALLALRVRITAESLQGVDRLILVSRWGVGYDTIDVDALTARDIALTITPAAVRRPVAEAILAFIFALTTNVIAQDKLVRRGGWRGGILQPGRGIAGKTLGSIGLGNIGRQLFAMAQSLGFGRLLATDPFVGSEVATPLGVELVALSELLRQSDYVAINAPLNAQTRGMIGAAELRLMKPTAYLINTARGAIVDESALVECVREGRIAGAALDVFATEPLPTTSPLRELDNMILAPHGIAFTEELIRDNTVCACDNILAVSRGEAPATVVNTEVLSRPGFQRKLTRYKVTSAS